MLCSSDEECMKKISIQGLSARVKEIMQYLKEREAASDFDTAFVETCRKYGISEDVLWDIDARNYEWDPALDIWK